MAHPLAQFTHCPRCGGSFVENNEKSNRCTACGFTYYFNPSSAVVAIITNEKGELLVCKRAQEPAKGTLDLPGGFVDMGESAEESVAREVREETGLEVVATRYLFSLPNTYPYSGFEVQTTDLFFACSVTSCSHLEAMDDVAECYFLPKASLTPTLFGLTSIRQGVERFLAQETTTQQTTEQ